MNENSLRHDGLQGGDAELARDLLSLHRAPSAALQRRVESIPGQATPRARVTRHLVWVIVALAVVGFVFASPTARAARETVQEVIGRVHLIFADLNPYRDEPVTLVEGEGMSLEEARERVSFDFAVPQGFTATEVTVYASGDSPDVVSMHVCDANFLCFELRARAHNDAGGTLVGPESVETILINGQEAAVLSGGWDSESGTWIEDVGQTTIIWETGGVQYELMTRTEAASLEELIAVAEAVQ